MPNETGYQDISSLLARQPGVGERWQKRVTGAAATIQLATYSFGRPIGTSAGNGISVRNNVGVRKVTADVASRYSPCSERSRTKALRNASFGTTSA